MLPRFRSDVTYYEVDEGVAFFCHGKWSKISGKNLFTALQHLVPKLDGKQSLEQLAQGMGVKQASRLEQLISLLSQNDIIRDAELDLPHELTDAVIETYAAEIAFLDGKYGSGAARFSNFRKKQILLLGDPSFQSKIAASLASLGAANVEVYPSLLPEQHEEVIHHRKDDEFTLKGVQDAAFMRTLNAADVVVLTAHFEPPYLWSQLLSSQKHVLPVLIHDDTVWIGSLNQRMPASFYVPQMQIDQHNTELPKIGGQFWSAQTVAYVASLIAFQVFSSVGSQKTSRPALKVNLETFEIDPIEEYKDQSLNIDIHQYLQNIEKQPSLSRADVSRHVLRLIGPHRPIELFGEANTVQLPLHIITATLCDGRQTVGYGLKASDARYEAALRALESLSEAPAGTSGVHPVTGQLVDFAGHEMLAISSGLSWQQAIDQSLLQLAMHCWYTSQSRYTTINETQDAEAQCLHEILLAFDPAAEVKWISNPLNIPVCEVSVFSQAAGLCISLSASAAYYNALLEAVARCQIGTSNSSSLQFPLGTAAVNQANLPLIDRVQLISTLEDTGWKIGLRPPIQDSRVNAVLPFIAQTFARRFTSVRAAE